MTNIHRIIPTYTEADNVTGCCPVFHPEEYDNQVFDLSDYQFIKDSTLSFMYMPVNMDKVFTHAMNRDGRHAYGYEDDCEVPGSRAEPCGAADPAGKLRTARNR